MTKPALFARIAFVLLVTTIVLAPSARAAEPSEADKQAITKFQDAWIQAAKARDDVKLQAMFGEGYIQTGPTGTTTDRAMFLQVIKDGTLQIESGSYSDVQIRVFGSTAVITGQLTIKATLGGGDISADYRFTQVLVKEKDAWQAVATQYATVK